MKLVQLRGANASGKTTIIKDLIAQSHEIEYLDWDLNGKPFTFATHMVDIKWAVIGSYPEGKKMGGTDCFPSPGTTELVKQAIIDTMDAIPDLFGVVFEGMMCSTVTGTWDEFASQQQFERNADPIFVVLKSTLQGTLNRIKSRATSFGKVGANVDSLNGKCEVVIHSGQKLEELGWKVVWIDVENVQRDYMLPAFLSATGDKQLLRYVYGDDE